MSSYAEWRERWASLKAIGYFCSYIPEELLVAAGFNPIRIIPGVTDASLSQTHLQSYTCYLSRACLHRAIKGELDFLAGMIFSHTCDTMQGLADIWPQARPGIFVETFNFPTVLSSGKAFHYTIAELERLKGRLEEFTGKAIGEESLREAVKLVNRKRALLQELASRRERMPASRFFQAVDRALTMPLEEAISFLESSKWEGEEPSGKFRILLAGSTLDDLSLVEAIEKSGGKIVEDDFCNGTRYFQTLADESLPPMEAIAKRLLERPLCPCKFVRTGAYSQNLVEKARKANAQGVILVRQKFCDPWGWEYPMMDSIFKENGIPLLMVEVEQPGAIGPAVTRIQAFLEMLTGG
ncbi:MAG: 2-hydroxyacyl-CoA dehydratase family protein [Anaerolineae bacterium]|nr:2-hydroxyacyl-CoA dehydratase family protein [Anaerolineae bacterium]MDW8102667.1 2-hydroxyacyl-CoA dehydratase family protein [Anaerolineae bacterium]